MDTQSSFSVVEMNSVGLKSGFFANLAELTLSSNFFEIVDLIVLAAGTSIASGAARFASMVEALGFADVVEEVAELEEDDDEDEDDEDAEQVLLSESESLKVVVCPGMLPVVVSV